MSLRLVVIGGGPGGYAAAFAAARAGMQVTLVEKKYLGGVCLNYGCIPTKTLKASAEALELALRLQEYGIDSQGITLNMPLVVERKEKVCGILRKGLEKTCAKLKITYLQGKGKILASDPQKVVQVEDDAGEMTTIEADRILLATGSQIIELPGLTFDHTHILDSDDALALTNIPEHLCIVGGGVIGCEMAFIYNAFGAKVTLVEGLERVLPLPSVDNDVSKLLQKEMKKHGIICEVGRTLKDVRVIDGKVHGVLAPSPFLEKHSAAQSKEQEIVMDAVLVSVGRKAHIEGLNLENVGVEVDAKGWIVADAQMQTSVSGIYAVGDALGPSRIMLAHVATMEGLCAVQHMLGHEVSMEYTAVPSAIFTTPEVGCVGLSEEQAKEVGFAVASSTFQMRELGKAHAMGEIAGFFKLVYEEESKKLLGAHIVGAHATDLIAELTLALQIGASIEDVAKTIHAHPTLAEGVFEAALFALE